MIKSGFLSYFDKFSYKGRKKIMIKGNIKLPAVFCAASLVLSACSHDISQTLPSEASAVEALAEITTTEVTTMSAEDTTTSTAAESSEPETEDTEPDITSGEAADLPEETTVTVSQTSAEAPSAQGSYTIYSDEYAEYSFSSEYNAFLSDCVFVGDSICSGLKAYDIIPSDRVVAVGNVAARNIFEDWVEFKVHGEKLPLIPALKELDPAFVVFSMGMNDVNMTSEQTFCQNYEKILSQVESALPGARLIVLSVTPITYGETGKLFTKNENIDSFNKALKEYLDSTGKWIYADVAHEMKNTSNMLKDNYLGSADGVHLAPEAYYAILHQLCERAVDGKVYSFDGTFSFTDAVKPIQTSAPEESAETTKKTKKTTADDGEVELSGTLRISDPE